MISKGSIVRHATFGVGEVRSVDGNEIIVRFDSGKVEICPPERLCEQDSERNGAPSFDTPLDFLPAVQAKCILSANARWGVFARSKIALLPHQLWVCQQARRKDPCRLLVADDVGLGKTIEAGLILSSFHHAGRADRVLVLTPASLTGQWQERMFSMFDIRMDRYNADNDTPQAGYWKSHNLVVASIDTLKLAGGGAESRRQRFLDAPSWSVVVVDEAHHLGNDEKTGATLGYDLIRELLDRGKVDALIFFTGTPHTGKNYKFLSLMHLLDDQTFSARRPLREQLGLLSDYMVRNNKYTVTDMRGNRLFEKPEIFPEMYDYSETEYDFYDTMSAFIREGLAYAATMEDGTQSRAVQLVLVALQKLASSSVAAIRHALEKRIGTISSEAGRLEKAVARIQDAMENGEGDVLATAEEVLPIVSARLGLLKDERPVLEKLVRIAAGIDKETKIETILRTIRESHSGDSILLFTEYKATQRAMLVALMREYGPDCATFINGDEQLDDVPFPDGTIRTISTPRTEAAREFNEGRKRFLVATEAAGEGIDLQSNCHVLFHVDLPWNPMRLQQRVGRLNRYGQKNRVVVRLFQNPATVESRIWECLNEKLAKIEEMLGAVMEERENLFDLVLGATPPGLFNDIFMQRRPGMDTPDGLSRYWDERTGKLGGLDPVEAVRSIGENVARFDFQNVSKILPDIELEAIRPFLRNALRSAGKMLHEDPDGTVSFGFPATWKNRPNEWGLFSDYQGLSFTRGGDIAKAVGVGFKPLDRALEKMMDRNGAMCCVFQELDRSWFVYSVRNRFTDSALANERHFYACSVDWESRTCEVLPDWKFLKLVNKLDPTQKTRTLSSTGSFESWRKEAEDHSAEAVRSYFRQHPEEETHHNPELKLECVLLAVPS